LYLSRLACTYLDEENRVDSGSGTVHPHLEEESPGRYKDEAQNKVSEGDGRGVRICIRTCVVSTNILEIGIKMQLVYMSPAAQHQSESAKTNLALREDTLVPNHMPVQTDDAECFAVIGVVTYHLLD
jgi:hypothetical protein